MKKRFHVLLIFALVSAGCSNAGNWNYVKPAVPQPGINGPSASACMDCHDREYKTWLATSHSDEALMANTPTGSRECGACHDSLAAHLLQPDKDVPVGITGLGKADQNRICGKVCTSCHAPHGASKAGHAMRMTTGFTVACLPCHMP